MSKRTQQLFKRLDKLSDRRELLAQQFRDLLPLVYPVGTVVVWKGSGPFPQTGTVVDVSGFAERLKVKNGRTGKTYWIGWNRLSMGRERPLQIW
jgi:hypothetical protein